MVSVPVGWIGWFRTGSGLLPTVFGWFDFISMTKVLQLFKKDLRHTIEIHPY